jgi:predicted nucleic acid-binding protein
MQENSDIIISDTSCLIILDKIDELELLGKVGRKIYVTPIILKEFGKSLPEWISVLSPKNSHYQQILKMDLDDGEASAIALSLDFGSAVLMLDELKGRKIAEKLNLRYSGTFGLILKAKQLGLISSVKPILDKIKSTNFRFNEKLFETVLEQAGELK